MWYLCSSIIAHVRMFRLDEFKAIKHIYRQTFGIYIYQPLQMILQWILQVISTFITILRYYDPPPNPTLNYLIIFVCQFGARFLHYQNGALANIYILYRLDLFWRLSTLREALICCGIAMFSNNVREGNVFVLLKFPFPL
jgi:hypothetical protein